MQLQHLVSVPTLPAPQVPGNAQTFLLEWQEGEPPHREFFWHQDGRLKADAEFEAETQSLSLALRLARPSITGKPLQPGHASSHAADTPHLRLGTCAEVSEMDVELNAFRRGPLAPRGTRSLVSSAQDRRAAQRGRRQACAGAAHPIAQQCCAAGLPAQVLPAAAVCHKTAVPAPSPHSLSTWCWLLMAPTGCTGRRSQM